MSLEAIGTATVVFISTNIDDILLLAVFFGDPKLRRGAIVAGQFIGIGALTAASVAAALAALAVPPGWPALLGVVPLGMGLYLLWRGRAGADTDDTDGGTRAVGTARFQSLGVAAVTIANGGDNLGVYIPMFAARTSAIPLFCAVFLALTAVWCALGYLLVRHSAGAGFAQRLGLLLPWVLIALGLYILWEARVLLG